MSSRGLAEIVLKVDVDTLRGTRQGVPRILDVLARHRVRASFFFSLGPDNMGKAVRRVFRRGFWRRKGLRALPFSSYGLRTMLYGTLLPAPDIGADPEATRQMREVARAGHECGILAWDNVDWHDRLTRMSRGEVEAAVAASQARFASIFGRPADTAAAAGWTATALSVEVLERQGIRTTSDTRAEAPFHPLRTDGAPSTILEIPTTLPTLDELVAWEEFDSAEEQERILPFLRALVWGREERHVHTAHAEIEGGRFAPFFEEQIRTWRGDGHRFATLSEAAQRIRAAGEVPPRSLCFEERKGRATLVAAARLAPGPPAPTMGSAGTD